MVIHSFCDLASVRLAEHRSLLYRTVGNRRIRYSSVVKLRLNLEREFQILSRLHGELDSDRFKIGRMLLSDSFTKLEPIDSSRQETWPLMILDTAHRKVSDLVENFRLVSKMVDDRIGLFTIIEQLQNSVLDLGLWVLHANPNWYHGVPYVLVFEEIGRSGLP